MTSRPALRLVRGDAPEPGAPPSPRRRDALELVALGAGLTLSMTLAAALPSWRIEWPRLLALTVLAFAFQGLALWRMRRWRSLPWAGAGVFAVALSARLALLPVLPTLGSGHGAAGSATAPLVQLGFALVSAWSTSVPALKIWIVAHDLVLVALLAWGSRRNTGSALGAIAYAWNPIVLLAYAGAAYHDPVALVWVVGALLAARERPYLSAVLLGVGVANALAALLALPFAWRSWSSRARALGLCLALVAILAWVLFAREAVLALPAMLANLGARAAAHPLTLLPALGWPLAGFVALLQRHRLRRV